MGFLGFLLWLLIGVVIGAFLLARFKIPPMSTSGYDKGDINPVFWWGVAASAFIWPLILLAVMFIWPALWIYERAKPKA